MYIYIQRYRNCIVNFVQGLKLITVEQLIDIIQKGIGGGELD